MRAVRCFWSWRPWATAVFAVASVSCTHPGAHQEARSSTASGAPATSSRAADRSQRLDHVAPARDSVGSAPKMFSWTSVQGADSYSIGVWNEVDVLVWRQNNIPTNSVTRPDDVPLEPGTYFWSISALRNGEELADSGLSAFVVRTSP
jgi:hypothetical protein